MLVPSEDHKSRNTKLGRNDRVFRTIRTMKPSLGTAVDYSAQHCVGGTNMLRELAFSTSLAALLLATPAWSQTSTYQTTQPSQQQATQPEAHSLIGKPVYGSDGKKIGEVNNVLIESNGRVRAAVSTS